MVRSYIFRMTLWRRYVHEGSQQQFNVAFYDQYQYLSEKQLFELFIVHHGSNPKVSFDRVENEEETHDLDEVDDEDDSDSSKVKHWVVVIISQSCDLVSNVIINLELTIWQMVCKQVFKELNSVQDIEHGNRNQDLEKVHGNRRDADVGDRQVKDNLE